MSENYKIKCLVCLWHGLRSEVDEVPDPRSVTGTTPDIWRVCPKCRTPENFRVLCDEPGCKREVSAGWPSPDGYRNTCSEHYRRVAI